MIDVGFAGSLGSWFAETARDGTLLLAIPIAMVAGLVSFFSPCVVPLLPGYLSYVTGLSGADLQDTGGRGSRGRMVLGVTLFILGFSLVFVSYGAIFGALGYQFLSHANVITKVLGVVTIVLGLVFMGGLNFLQRDIRIHTIPSVGVAAAPLIGVLFGFGWTPCIGPTLAVVVSLSYESASPGRGALLTFAYCLGLGIPFVLAALAFHRMARAVSWVREHQVWLMRFGGAMLVAVGVLLLTGAWDTMIASMRGWVTGFEPVV